jgi:hypothetical protein
MCGDYILAVCSKLLAQLENEVSKYSLKDKITLPTSDNTFVNRKLPVVTGSYR